MQYVVLVGLFVMLLALLGLADGLKLKPTRGVVSNLAGNLVADVAVMGITYARVMYSGPATDVLQAWYDRFGLSASVADVLIGTLYIGVAQAIATTNETLSKHVILFALLAVAVQMVGDMLFYLLMRVGRSTAVGGFFTEWGKLAGVFGLVGDAALVLLAVLIASVIELSDATAQAYLALFALFAVCIVVHLNAPRVAAS